MKCPTCKDSVLTISERKGIEIDFCPECRGIWLDRGELDKILERSREEESRVAQPQEQHHHKSDHYRHEKPYKRRKSFLEELFD